jgi:ribosomal protein L11 methyltransferase
MNQTYYQIQLLNVSNSLEERVSDLCFEFGALGVSEKIQLSPETDPERPDQPIIIKTPTKNFDVYFEAKPINDFYEKIFGFVKKDQVVGAEFENKDWLEEWKKGYHAFSLIHNIWVVPSWEKAPENVDAIYIDPGMAFGTGTHQTTQLCAELMYPLLKEKLDSKKINSMIDVGTGTAILAMLAAKMGVQEVLGTEIDTESVVTANENLAINKLVSIKVIEAELSKVEGQYDLVVSNIIDGVLLDLKPDLLRLSKPNSFFVLSGILEERDDHFITEFLKDTTLKVEKRIQKDEWIGYLLAGHLSKDS